MNDLDKLCKAPSAHLSLDHIMSHCNSYAMAWQLDAMKIIMIIVGASLVGFFVLLDRRKELKNSPPPAGETEPTVWSNPMLYVWTAEGFLYGGLAVWAGSAAGLVIALMVKPNILGMLLLLFAVLAVLMMIASLVKNTADAGDIALGVICHVLLAGGLVVAAIMAFQVPSKGPAGDAYQTYLWLITLLFTGTALADSWVVSIFRGYHWAIGWLLVPLSASWGLIGNLLGLMNHIACTFYFSNSGDEDDTRAFYVLYKSGFTLKANFDYTQGDAMSASQVPKHEAVHVIQHFLFGPVYPLSYGLWAAIMFLPGIIVGIATRDPATNRGVGEGINDLCYYNCPWEQIAYQFEGGYGSDVVIFNKYVGWPVYIAWIIGATLLMVLFIVSRT
jgi:hypothetical protein